MTRLRPSRKRLSRTVTLGLFVCGCATQTGGPKTSIRSPCVAAAAPVRVTSTSEAPPREPASPRREDPKVPSTSPLTLEDYQNQLTRPAPPRKDWLCPPTVSPELAEVLFQGAERLIKQEGEHVSPGALEVILPLLQLAAHSGLRAAQRRYGYYVVGYYMTDEMFWPSDKRTAIDALAWLRVLATEAPDQVANDATWILGGIEPSDPGKRFPAEWLKGAKAAESRYLRCHGAQ